MSLLGLQTNMNQMYQSRQVTTVSPVKQVPEHTTQTEAPQKVEPKYDSYAPSQEGLDYLQTRSLDNIDSVASVEVMEDGVSTGALVGDPTIMPEIDQSEDAAIPDDLIDPTDFTNPDTYDPDAWLESYYAEKADPNTSEIGAGSGVTTEDVPENNTFDPSDYTNMETYDPYAWLANYRGESVPEKTTTPVETETSTDSVTTPDVSDEVEESTSSSFDLQAFLSEGESIVKDITAYLSNAASSLSDTESWLGLLQSTKLF